PDLPSPLPALGPAGQAGARTRLPRPRPQGTGQARSVRVFHPRYLRGGAKGGVGATKRGKGTKLMAVADRLGIPLAACAASAAPARRSPSLPPPSTHAS